jgi:hypothetical protein
VRVARRKETQQATVATLGEQGEENEVVAQQIQARSLEYGRSRAEVAEYIARLAVIQKRSREMKDWED